LKNNSTNYKATCCAWVASSKKPWEKRLIHSLTRIWRLAKQVIQDDDFADDMNMGIQTRAMQLLALQQPMARDLRIVGSSLRIVIDLERIGDHAVDIAKIARSLAGQTYFKPLVDIPRLGCCRAKW
jgi:phosphate transport system protein